MKKVIAQKTHIIKTLVKNKNTTVCLRDDGLKVFLDNKKDNLSLWLNDVRHYGTKKQVILAVGFIRGLQIAMNYAEKYGDDLELKESDFIIPALNKLERLERNSAGKQSTFENKI